MITTRRHFVKLVGGAAVAAGAALDAGPASAQAAPVKLGVLAIRAGIAAPVGTAGLRSTEWWLERVNKAGGILGRPVQLIVEEESNPKDTVERYRKLILQDKVEAVLGGISTGVTLALGPVADDLGTPWLSWDGTTQKGVEETMPNPKWAFKSVDNEVEAIVAGMLTAKYFKGVKTVAGIGNDYSYGHDCWESYQAVLKKYTPDVKFVLELFPKLGVTDFTSHIVAIQQSKADLLMCSFWSGDARSEEHTSELQSQSNLVCRLLLEQKTVRDGRTVNRSLRRPIPQPGVPLRESYCPLRAPAADRIQEPYRHPHSRFAVTHALSPQP